jgi:PhzF family phenazine biosynthesis protein
MPQPVFRELYQVDAFTLHSATHPDGAPFTGNPAAVCPMPEGASWPEDGLLLAIADENHLSETAYYRPSKSADADYDLRWFTPETEVDLCGHATLATAFVLFEEKRHAGEMIRFATRSGIVRVRRDIKPGLLTLDFPARSCRPMALPPELTAALGGRAPDELHATDNGVWLALYASQSQVRELRPDFEALRKLNVCVLATSPWNDPLEPEDEPEPLPPGSPKFAYPSPDFVSRYFAPHKGINEDPVTGSAHCILMPFWNVRLGKMSLMAQQASRRGGTLWCTLKEHRVLISGSARLFFRGEFSGNPGQRVQRAFAD